MADNLGKKFEQKFRECWISTFPNSFIYRLQDQMSGYKVISRNPCDWICFTNNTLFLIECKTIKGKLFPFSNLTQYERLKDFVGIEGVRCGIVCWFYSYDKVLYIPISTVTQMLNNNIKSVNIQNINQYHIIDIPSKKLRTFMDSDYSCLLNLKEGD